VCDGRNYLEYKDLSLYCRIPRGMLYLVDFWQKCRLQRPTLKSCGTGAEAMEWVTPEHEVINLNCEVSSYENAEL